MSEKNTEEDPIPILGPKKNTEEGPHPYFWAKKKIRKRTPSLFWAQKKIRKKDPIPIRKTTKSQDHACWQYKLESAIVRHEADKKPSKLLFVSTIVQNAINFLYTFSLCFNLFIELFVRDKDTGWDRKSRGYYSNSYFFSISWSISKWCAYLFGGISYNFNFIIFAVLSKAFRDALKSVIFKWFPCIKKCKCYNKNAVHAL